MSRGEATVQGRHYDGRQPLAQPATLHFSGPETALSGDDWSRSYRTATLRVSPRTGHADRFIALPDGGQFQCPDHVFLDGLPQDSRGEGLVAWLEARTAVALAGIALIAVTLTAGYRYGLPWAATSVAERIPVETERQLGIDALAWLDNSGWLAASHIDTDRQTLIHDDFAALVRDLPSASGLRLEFRDSQYIGANAFAFPGGIIVVTDDMVNAARTGDELSAVLAHEVGHVERRHALRGLLQDSAVAIAASAVTADAASLSAAVAGLPAALARTRYSREFETEADDFAFGLLRQHGRSPQAFADIMERLAGGDEDDDLAFLSTHPITAERVRRAREAARR